jgi:hypothetical protein
MTGKAAAAISLVWHGSVRMEGPGPGRDTTAQQPCGKVPCQNIMYGRRSISADACERTPVSASVDSKAKACSRAVPSERNPG